MFTRKDIYLNDISIFSKAISYQSSFYDGWFIYKLFSDFNRKKFPLFIPFFVNNPLKVDLSKHLIKKFYTQWLRFYANINYLKKQPLSQKTKISFYSLNKYYRIYEGILIYGGILYFSWAMIHS